MFYVYIIVNVCFMDIYFIMQPTIVVASYVTDLKLYSIFFQNIVKPTESPLYGEINHIISNMLPIR